jgi:hypothetical protein
MLRATKHYRFVPAKLNGEPVAAHIHLRWHLLGGTYDGLVFPPVIE